MLCSAVSNAFLKSIRIHTANSVLSKADVMFSRRMKTELILIKKLVFFDEINKSIIHEPLK